MLLAGKQPPKNKMYARRTRSFFYREGMGSSTRARMYKSNFSTEKIV